MAESTATGISRDKLARGAWLLVGLLWVVALLNYLDRQVLVTMRDAVKADILVDGLAMSDAKFGLLTSVFLWTYGALSPVGGFLADKFGRRPVIFVSLAVWSAVTWWTGHVSTYSELVFARALMGVSEACYIPAALALITDHHRGPTRSLATGLHMSGLYAGMVLGGLGGYLATPGKPLIGFDLFIGWHKAFAVLGGIGVAYAVALIFLLPKEAAATEPVANSPAGEAAPGMLTALRKLAGEGRFWLLMGMFTLVSACNWSVLTWLPAFLKEHFHLQDGPAGLHATSWGTAAKFAAVLVGGVLSDLFSRKSERARALIPACGLLLAAPGIVFGTLTDTLALGLLGFAMQGVAQGFLDANMMPMLRQVTGRSVAATGYGLLNFVGCAAGGVMAALGGRLKDSGLGFETFFRISAAGLAAAAVLLFFFRPARRVG
jgi:MFS family permease